MYRPVASQFLIDGIFVSVRVTLSLDTCKCFKAHLACDKNCGHCEGKICNNKDSQIDYPFEED